MGVYCEIDMKLINSRWCI